MSTALLDVNRVVLAEADPIWEFTGNVKSSWATFGKSRDDTDDDVMMKLRQIKRWTGKLGRKDVMTSKTVKGILSDKNFKYLFVDGQGEPSRSKIFRKELCEVVSDV